MKPRVIIFFLFFPFISSGQYNYNFLKEFYFARQPSARAEAMGKGYSSIDGDLSTMFFNPAGTATLQGLALSGSMASPYYLLKKAKYSFIGAGYKINPHLFIGLSRNNFSLGENIYSIDINGNISGFSTNDFYSNYCMNLSSQPIKNLLIGLNANYFIWHPRIKK